MTMGRLGYVLAWVLVAVLAWGYAERRDLQQRYRDYEQRQQDLEATEVEVEELETHVEQTRHQVERLHSDPLEMEAAIRRNKGLVRPGEIVFRIEKDETAGTAREPDEGEGAARKHREVQP